MTDEQRLELGAAARELILSDPYVIAMRALEAQHVHGMINSEEGHYGVQDRETHNRMLHAMRALAGELAGYVATATEISTRLSLEGDDEEDDIT